MLSRTVGGYLPADWVLLFFGLGAITVALLFGSRWNIRPIELNSEKFGTLKLPFASFVTLVGIALVAVGVYFRWQETQIGAVEHQKLETKLEELTQELERFKNYEMRVQLDFHTSVDPAKLHTDLLILKPGDPSPRLVDQGVLRNTQASNILSATVPSLGPGDTIYFVAHESGFGHPRIWESEKLVIPIAQLNMSPKE